LPTQFHLERLRRRDRRTRRTREAQSDGANVYAVDVDLATREGCHKLCEEVRALGRLIDALALNAGIGVGGEFLKADLDAELRGIDLNCAAVVRLARQLLPDMVAHGKGRVLITSSVAAVMPAPYEAVYGATKAFDLSFAEALREELHDTGITVTALQPGATETEFFERAGMEDTRIGREDKDDPALVARQGFEAMMRGDDKVYAGSLKSRAQGLAGEILPEPTKAKLHAKQAEPGSGVRARSEHNRGTHCEAVGAERRVSPGQAKWPKVPGFVV
jgi:short-subunit dehydrogenase